MPDEDASLTDFLPADGDESSAEDDEEPPAADDDPGDDPARTAGTTDEDADDATSEEVEDRGVEPAAATATWTPDGGACADCGASVERRWRDGEALVCGDCKDWRRSDGGG